MKILHHMKRPAPMVIALLMILGLLLPPAAMVSAQAGGTTTSNFTIENFKFKDVLGSGWSLNTDYGSEVDDYGASLSDFGMYKLAQPLTQLGKWFQLRLLGPKPTRGHMNVDIYWTQDSQAIQDIKTQAFTREATSESSCGAGKYSLCHPLYREGNAASGRVMRIFWSDYSAYGTWPEGDYIVALPNALIEVSGGQAWADYNYLATMLRGMEQMAEKLVPTTASGKTLIQLVQYHPFAPKDPSLQGGDIVATVTNNGEPVVGAIVYLFINRPLSDDIFKRNFTMPYTLGLAQGKESHFLFNSPAYYLGKSDVYSAEYWNGVTNQYGMVTFSYQPEAVGGFLVLGFDGLAFDLAKNGCKPVVGVVSGVVVDRELTDYAKSTSGPPPKVLASADVTLTFNFTARITKIIYRGPGDRPGNVTVKHPGVADTVVDMGKVGSFDAATRPAPELWGYPLYYGDKIVMRQYDEVIVQWLPGVTLGFKARDEWLSYKIDTAEVWIGTTDSGLHDSITVWANKWGLNAALGGIAAGTGWKALSVGIYAKPSLWATLVGLAPLAWQLGDWWKNPLVIEPHSQILINFDDNATIWTLEGTATVFSTGNQSNVDVTTNHSMQVAADGTFGKVTTFKQSDLSPGLASLAKDLQNSVTLAAATPAPSQAPSGQLPAAGQPQVPFPTINPYGGAKSDSKMGEFLQVVLPIIALVSLVMAISFVVRRRRKTAPVLSQPVARDISQSSLSGRPSDSGQSSAGEKRFCHRCANPVRDGDVYCGKCGAALPSATPVGTVIGTQPASFCSRCGERAQSGERFCGKCGTALSVMSETPSVAPPVATAPAYCPRCGTPNSGRGRFCRKCGTQLIS